MFHIHFNSCVCDVLRYITVLTSYSFFNKPTPSKKMRTQYSLFHNPPVRSPSEHLVTRQPLTTTADRFMNSFLVPNIDLWKDNKWCPYQICVNIKFIGLYSIEIFIDLYTPRRTEINYTVMTFRTWINENAYVHASSSFSRLGPPLTSSQCCPVVVGGIGSWEGRHTLLRMWRAVQGAP